MKYDVSNLQANFSDWWLRHLLWMVTGLTDDKLTLGQVMAWCRQARSHYLNQCWPISMPPYGITRPQWVNSPQLHPYPLNKSVSVQYFCIQQLPSEVTGAVLAGCNLHILCGTWRSKAQINGLVQERHNSSALAMEICLSCTNQSKWYDLP